MAKYQAYPTKKNRIFLNESFSRKHRPLRRVSKSIYNAILNAHLSVKEEWKYLGYESITEFIHDSRLQARREHSSIMGSLKSGIDGIVGTGIFFVTNRLIKDHYEKERHKTDSEYYQKLYFKQHDHKLL